MRRRQTRRTLLRGLGGALGTGVLAGCVGGSDTERSPDAVRYLVAFHWGFRWLAPDGTVTDRVTLAPDSTLAVRAVNLEPVAEGVELSLPDPVARTVTARYRDWEAASLDRIAAEVGLDTADLRRRLDEAESRFPDHAAALFDPDGGIVFNVTLGADVTAPRELTVSLRKPGAYDLKCTGHCGFGHAYMRLPGAVVARTTGDSRESRERVARDSDENLKNRYIRT